LGNVRPRILIGIGAWLLGVATATAGCLLVVSRLGEGIAASPGQQLTVSMVNRALASEAAEKTTPVPSIRLGGTATPITRSATPPPSALPTASPIPQPASGTDGTSGTAGTGGTVLTSSGGTVVAGCQAAGAYLLSWSPQQGYEAGGVVRGPAATAQVVFTSDTRVVTMVVSCSGGVPSAATHVSGGPTGGDE
jgi:hypothetical protein